MSAFTRWIRAGADTLKGLFEHSVRAIGPVRVRANQMVL